MVTICDVARTQTLVQLNDDLVAALDEEAEREGTSRSAVVRQAITAFLAERQRSAIDAAIVEGYTRIPPGQLDEWGDLEAQSDQLAREAMQRLDAEERAAGFGPW